MAASQSALGTSVSVQSAVNSTFADARVIPAGTTVLSDEVVQDGLPQFNVWFEQQSAGVGAIEITPQFLNTAGSWQKFSVAIVTVLDVPELRHYTLGAPKYRLQVRNTAGGPITVSWRLSATLPGA